MVNPEMDWYKWKCDVTGDRYSWHCVCHPDAGEPNTFRWVNEDAKVVWWQVPRAASASIARTIGNLWRNSAWRVMSPKELDKGVFPYEDYYNFGVVKNPWDRVLSCYNLYTTFGGRQDESNRIAECKLLFYNDKNSKKLPKFNEFIERMFNEGSRNHHWAPVSCYLPEEDADFDWHPIYIENLTSEWDRIAGKYGFPKPLKFVTGEGGGSRGIDKKPYQEIYEKWPGTKELIEQYYEEDIRRFEFKYEN